MRRFLSNLFTALSLLLFVAVCVLWVRSYWSYDTIGWISYDDSGDSPVEWRRGANTARGRCTLETQIITLRPSVQFTSRHESGFFREALPLTSHQEAPFPASSGTSFWRYLGLSADRHQVSNSGAHITWQYVTFPLWSLLPVLLVMPLFVGFRRFRTRLRKSGGLCRACGYNLTGNTSGTCPECGSAIIKEVTA